MWMAQHGREDLRIDNVPQARYQAEKEEQHKVEYEEDDGNDSEPVPVVRQLVEHDRYNSRAHRDNEPSVAGWLATSISIA